MNSLPIACKDAATTFLLARRAERLARPLVDMTGGAWGLSITTRLGHSRFLNPWHVSIDAFYTDGAEPIPGNVHMPFQEFGISTSQQLEEVIEKMRCLVLLQVEANAKVGADDAND